VKNITIVEIGKRKNKRDARFKGTFEYWEKSINRLSVFADTFIDPGFVVDGSIDKVTRLKVYKVFKRFMNQYKGVIHEENRPFSYTQETEIRRVLFGGTISF